MLTALVVDDSAGARRRIATLLGLGGWEVHQAAGTAAALRVADEVDLDLVVTDMVMREGNGVALLHRLRSEGYRARSVVVAAQLTDVVREHAAAAGAVACLAKPVVPRELLDVMHLLTGKPVPRARTVQAAPLRVDAERLDGLQETYGPAVDRRAVGRARLLELVALSVSAHARMPAPSRAPRPDQATVLGRATLLRQATPSA